MIENVSQGQEFSGIISVKNDTFLSIRFREVEIITILTKSPNLNVFLIFVILIFFVSEKVLKSLDANQ